MIDTVEIIYNGKPVSVPKEVADFLEQDRKREQAQEKQDKRHLSKSEFETVLPGPDCVRRPVEDAVIRNLRLENLRKAVDGLDDQGKDLIELRYSTTWQISFRTTPCRRAAQGSSMPTVNSVNSCERNASPTATIRMTMRNSNMVAGI